MGQTRTATKVAKKQTDSGATTGYEAELWAMADTLRGSGAFRVILRAVGWPRIDDRRSPRGTGRAESGGAANGAAIAKE